MSFVDEMGFRIFLLAVTLMFGGVTAGLAENPRVISFIGDSTTSAAYSPPGFPKLVGKILGVPVHNLAVKFPPSYTTVQALAEELPLVPKDTTDAVLFLGLDDLRYLGMGATPLDETITANAAIVAKLHARGIRVYQVLIRDYMKDPMFHPQPRDLEALPHVSYFVKRLNAAYRAPSVKIIDAPSWADVYKGAWSSGGIHFEAASLKLFARHMAEALR